MTTNQRKSSYLQLKNKLRLAEAEIVALRAAASEPISSTPEAAVVMRELLSEYLNTQEAFGIISLNAKNKIVASKVIHIGSTFNVDIYPKDVFRQALLDNAVGIVVGHNHPSGELQPSAPDTGLTKRVADCAHIIGIDLLDHIIVSATGYYSYAESHPTALRPQRYDY